uniref:SCP domain-containing protein n=1 Tax=Rhabditophanes sp. KR3021 TaxID=114890 RepID=A0AC35TNF2_9BILA
MVSICQSIVLVAVFCNAAMAATNVTQLKVFFLSETNKFRLQHQVGAVTVDPVIAASAQKWADYLAFTVKGLQHSSNSPYGENLAYASESIGNRAVQMWYDEVKLYNFNKPGFSGATGHFTQLVWKKSTKVGFGVTVANGIVYTVCQYSPPGNYLGQFPQNVFPKK